MPALPGLFVIGTDTAVGKTRIAAGIARVLCRQGRRVGVLKPVATSAELQPDGGWQSPDATLLSEAIGGDVSPSRIAPIVLAGDVAPCVAARLAGHVLDHAEVVRSTIEAIAWWGERCEALIVEGVGGLLCPLAEDSTVADLAVTLDYPLVIVARRGLGTLNHTLLTVEVARLRGLRIAGVVLNGAEPTTNPVAEATNPDELTRRLGRIPILADLPHAEPVETLGGAMHGVDWWGTARLPRLPPSDAPRGTS